MYTFLGVIQHPPAAPSRIRRFDVLPSGHTNRLLALTLRISTYADLAAQLKQIYKQLIPPSAETRIRKDFIVPFTAKIADLARQLPPFDLPAPTEPMLASVGILDSCLKRN